jgi:flagellar basal body-associated protein FliL
VEQRPLHWSERAKMYPSLPGTESSGTPQPKDPQGSERPRTKQPRGKSPKGRSSHKGLLVTMIVILLVAAAAAVVLLWYLPSRSSDTGESELTARNLVRQAATAIDQAYEQASTFDPQTMAPNTLKAIAPTITFHPVSDTSAATSPSAQAKDNAVNYAGTQTSYAVGTMSQSGTTYGVVVDKQTGSKTYYLGGKEVADWEQAGTSTSATDASDPTQTSQSSQTTNVTTHTQIGPASAASDAAAMTLLRNAMTTVASAFASVNTFEPSLMTASLLQQMEPSTTFVIRDGDEAATAPVSFAGDKTVDFYGTATTYSVGTTSESGTTFGVVVSKGAGGQTTAYYVNGQVEDWSTQLVIPAVGDLVPNRG